jgi:hypothetical protein
MAFGMSLTDKDRPGLDIDYDAGWPAIAEQYRVAYFKLELFASRATLRSNLWRIAAVYGWGTVLAMCLAELFG